MRRDRARNAGDPPGPELAEVVEEAYRVFGDRRVGRRLHVCRCAVCFGDDATVEAALVSTPLRDIPAATLAEYTNSAHGWHEEMEYFLPRYLDLLARGEEVSHIGFEYSLSRLSYADWRETWPAAEREVVERFFESLLAHALGRPTLELTHAREEPHYWRSAIADVFGLVANAGGAVGPLLRRWDATRGPMPNLHLAALVNEASMALALGRLGWDLRDRAAEEEVAAWLLREETARRLEAAFFAATEPVDQRTFSTAVALLGR